MATNIMKLNDREWKEFRIYDIFNYSRGKRQTENSRIKGNIPYYSASQDNNGLTDFISNPTFTINTNAIIYSTFGDAYYVEKFFSTSDEITILVNPILNKYNALFICSCINQNKSKYSFGRKAFSNKISKDKIMLPTKQNNNNKPDYKFMELYIKEKYNLKENKYYSYLNKTIDSLKYKKISSLNKKEWKEFFLIDLFPTIQRGKRLTKNNQITGNTPYISSTSLNNGVNNYISNDKEVRLFSNCLTIANSGSVGASFYHSFEFVASDHVTHLKNTNMNKYIYLFIATLTSRLSEKYNFNREINDKRISNEKIMLPINNKNKPDYKYMEQYMINLMISKYTNQTKVSKSLISKVILAK